jgi:hypothetical protein
LHIASANPIRHTPVLSCPLLHSCRELDRGEVEGALERHLESVSRVIPLLLREQMIRARPSANSTTNDFGKASTTQAEKDELRAAMARYRLAFLQMLREHLIIALLLSGVERR